MVSLSRKLHSRLWVKREEQEEAFDIAIATENLKNKDK